MGALSGIKIIEFAGLGPTPFCAMMLADMGAEVIRIDRKNPGSGGVASGAANPVDRGRRSLALDLKQKAGVDTALRLISRADVLLEGFRPGVMERLGLGPEPCLQHNPGLVYGRMTGWGQTGPLAQAAGHDINYIALSGALYAMGSPDQPPAPPLNLVGDYGGGGMLLGLGVLAALLERHGSGKGQIIDAAMTDGAASLMSLFCGLQAAGRWTDRRGSNLLDGGAHFYGTYACKNGGYISIGAIEPQFYAELLQRCGLEDPIYQAQLDARQWPLLKTKLSEVFSSRTREEWCELLEGSDVCFAPVLSLSEAPAHPHNAARETFLAYDGMVQPAPSPRFSRTPSAIQSPPPRPGQHSEEVLVEWGFSEQEVAALRASETI